MILKTQSCKKSNNPFKTLLKQHIILCDNIAESLVEMLEHVQQLDNEEMPNAHDVEDWLNLENELLTSQQMSDEEILATVVGDLTESKSVCSDEEDEGKDEKIVSTKEAVQCFKKCLSWMESQNDIDPVQCDQATSL